MATARGTPEPSAVDDTSLRDQIASQLVGDKLIEIQNSIDDNRLAVSTDDSMLTVWSVETPSAPERLASADASLGGYQALEPLAGGACQDNLRVALTEAFFAGNRNTRVTLFPVTALPMGQLAPVLPMGRHRAAARNRRRRSG